MRFSAPFPSVPKLKLQISHCPLLEIKVALAASPKIVLFDLSPLLIYFEYVSEVIKSMFVAIPADITFGQR